MDIFRSRFRHVTTPMLPRWTAPPIWPPWPSPRPWPRRPRRPRRYQWRPLRPGRSRALLRKHRKSPDPQTDFFLAQEEDGWMGFLDKFFLKLLAKNVWDCSFASKPIFWGNLCGGDFMQVFEKIEWFDMDFQSDMDKGDHSSSPPQDWTELPCALQPQVTQWVH